MRLINILRKIKILLSSYKEVSFYLNRVLWEVGYPWTKIRPTPLNKIFPGIDSSDKEIIIQNSFNRRRRASIELDELLSILEICKFFQVKNILEIGTSDGNTTLNMALNIKDGGSVVTFDLPPDSNNFNFNVKTKRQFNGHKTEELITQVLADSTTFDWDNYNQTFDLVFIDADHSERAVLSDTINSLKVLNPGGLIIWHDYNYKSVSSIIDKAYNLGEPIFWIKSTRLATAQFENPQKSSLEFS